MAVPNSPFPYFLCDRSLSVIERNEAAEALGDLDLTMSLAPADAAALATGGSGEIACQLEDHQYSLHYRVDDLRVELWLVDRTREVLLEEKLKKALRPDLKLFRGLESLIATVRGQCELMSVMLEHGDEFTVDQLKVIRGCQSEINAKLAQCEDLILNSRRNRSPAGGSDGKSRLVVVHQDQVRAELIGELFQLDGWHVEVFQDADTAAGYITANLAGIAVLVADSEYPFVDVLLDANTKASAVVIGPVSRLRTRLLQLSGTPLDINELQETVLAMMSRRQGVPLEP